MSTIADLSAGGESPRGGFLSRMFSGLYSAYNNLNGATLTGAIDIIVVRHEDGSLHCSPFHVRFGKTGVLSSKEKEVEVVVNGESMEGLQMRLGDSGEAYFLEELTLAEQFRMQAHLRQQRIRKTRGSDQCDGPTSQRKAPEVNVPASKRVIGRKKSVYCKTLQERCDEITNQLLAYEEDYQQDKQTNRSKDELREGLTQRRKRFTKTRGDTQQRDDGATSSEEEDLFNLELTRTSDTMIVWPPELSTAEVVRKADSDLLWDVLDENLHDGISAETEIRGSRLPHQRRSGLQSLTSVEQQQLTFQLNEDVLPRLSLQVCSDVELSDNETVPRRRVSAAKSDTELDHCAEENEANWGWGRLPDPEGDLNPQTSAAATSTPRIAQQPTVATAASRRTSRRNSHPISSNRTSHTSAEPSQVARSSEQNKVKEKIQQRESVNEGLTRKISGDVFLDDLLPAAEKDPQISERYFGRPRSTSEGVAQNIRKLDPPIPADVSLSLCGSFANGTSLSADTETNLEAFEQCRVTFETLCNDPSLLDDPSLVVRINGENFTWKAASPIIASLVVFRRLLPPVVMSSIRDRQTELSKSKNSPPESAASSPSSWWPWAGSVSQHSDSGVSADEVSPASSTITKSSPQESLMDSQEYKQWLGSQGEVLTTIGGKIYRRTLRLSSECLLQLGLKSGVNDVEFSVTTSLQGTTRATCHIFLWEATDKVVVSDIDGTITISDILGHVMPMLGKGWEHSGVAALFNKVANNGYKFIYLSARAIGQASMTRGYLKAIRQDSQSLPDGPVLLNPTSLLNAFHREVIIKRPQDFKISCLKDIQSLFPSSNNAFYAGFGNRLTDTLSYRAVSIDTSRIFTVNPKGELSQELVPEGASLSAVAFPAAQDSVTASPGTSPTMSCMNSSYRALSDICDQIFPPLTTGSIPNAGPSI